MVCGIVYKKIYSDTGSNKLVRHVLDMKRQG